MMKSVRKFTFLLEIHKEIDLYDLLVAKNFILKLIREGSEVECDTGDIKLELPSWYDEKKFKR